MAKHKRKNTESPALQGAADAKRKRSLLVLTDLGKPEFKVFSVRELDRLNVDELYQRIKITPWVNTLAAILLAGGEIPGVAVIARRPNGSLWIVDGQQRFWACSEAKQPLKCLVYDVPDEADRTTERKMFEALNATVLVKAEHIVKASASKTAQLIREANDEESSAMLGRVYFRGNGTGFSASVLARGISTLLGGQIKTRINVALSSADYYLEQPGSKGRVLAYLELCGKVCKEGRRQTLLEAIALAKVARERWNGRIDLPSEKEITGLARINFESLCPGHALKWLPLATAAIQERWPQT